jgi:hypothetical protein
MVAVARARMLVGFWLSVAVSLIDDHFAPTIVIHAGEKWMDEGDTL